MELKKVALITCVSSIGSSLPSIWGTVRVMTSRGVTGAQWWVIPSIALVLSFASIMPVFYFALYHDESVLRFPTHLRKLSLVAAVTFIIVEMIRYSQRIGGWNWVSILTVVANLAYVLLLLAISRNVTEDVPTNIPASDLLVSITKVAVVAWGIWVSFQLLRLAFTVLSYSSMRQLAYQLNRAAPSLREMVLDVVLTFFSQACFLAAPYILWRSGFGRRVPQVEQL